MKDFVPAFGLNGHLIFIMDNDGAEILVGIGLGSVRIRYFQGQLLFRQRAVFIIENLFGGEFVIATRNQILRIMDFLL